MNREDLKNYLHNQGWIKRQLEKYMEQKSMVYNMSQTLDGMPKAQNKPNYLLESLMDKYDEMIQMLLQDQIKQNEILLQLKRIPQPFRNILTFKYINGKKLEEIAVEIGYSYDRTCKMHGTALNLFDKLESGQ